MRPFLALLVFASLASAQDARLRVELPRRTVTLGVDDLRALPTDTVRFGAHGDPPRLYRAVRFSDVLMRAGLPLDSMKVAEAWVVVAGASDGYHAAFSAAELDPKTGPTAAWIAFEREGNPIVGAEGPFRSIVTTDKRAARSVHMLRTLTVRRLATAAKHKPATP